MDHLDYSFLYGLATDLNRQVVLGTALRSALEQTVQHLSLAGGWIWLTQAGQQSVYLAASYQLPNALREQPERLSGWCYCIEKYLSNDFENPSNVSEIVCTRLRDLPESQVLRYHATIPILANEHKIGILNLLHEETRQLSAEQLALLQEVGKLLGTTIQRTQGQGATSPAQDTSTKKMLDTFLAAELAQAIRLLEENPIQSQQALFQLRQLQEQLQGLQSELQPNSTSSPTFRYPQSPLSERELEVLQYVQQGLTNRQIAEQLFIAERTVKFHLTGILGKLEAKTRTEAVAVARLRGWIT